MKRFLIIILILLIGCCKTEPTYYNNTVPPLTQNELAFVPYQGNETLKFINDDSTQLILEGKGRVLSNREKVECGGSKCDDDCWIYDYEYDETIFKSIDSLYNIKIWMSAFGKRTGGSKETVDFHIETNDDNYSFESENLDSLCQSSRDFINCLDSTIINGKIYYDIMIFWNTLYYTKKNGIIKFPAGSGKNWYLVN